MSNKRIAIVILIILVLGVFLSVFLAREVTQTKQEASTLPNINKGNAPVLAKNKDGTMGPSSYLGNYSNTLAKNQLGNLTVLITDPPSDKPSFPTRIPTVSRQDKATLTPTKSPPAGSKNYKSLIVQIKKAEVHLTSKDKWETFKMDYPISVDLVQLQNKETITLAATQLAEGKYSEIRLYISSATAVMPDNTIRNLSISDKDWVVRIEQEFNISQNKNTTLTVDFDAQSSIVFEQNRYYLKPVVLGFLVK